MRGGQGPGPGKAGRGGRGPIKDGYRDSTTLAKAQRSIEEIVQLQGQRTDWMVERLVGHDRTLSGFVPRLEALLRIVQLKGLITSEELNLGIRDLIDYNTEIEKITKIDDVPGRITRMHLWNMGRTIREMIPINAGESGIMELLLSPEAPYSVDERRKIAESLDLENTLKGGKRTADMFYRKLNELEKPVPQPVEPPPN